MGQNSFLEYATNANGSFLLLQSNIVGQPGTSSANGDAILYRVGVP